MDNITRIREGLRNKEYISAPNKCAEDLSILSGEYAFLCGLLEDITQRKPAVWNELRKEVKSDTACERLWEASADGVNEAGIRLRMKGCEKMMVALKSLIKIAEGESMNRF
jgi:hypothetical protein